jgi:hypothetical protein
MKVGSFTFESAWLTAEEAHREEEWLTARRFQR